MGYVSAIFTTGVGEKYTFGPHNTRKQGVRWQKKNVYWFMTNNIPMQIVI